MFYSDQPLQTLEHLHVVLSSVVLQNQQINCCPERILNYSKQKTSDYILKGSGAIHAACLTIAATINILKYYFCIILAGV